MRVVILGALAALVAGAAYAQGSNNVRGYFRSDGTYVAPHYRSNPNNTRSDNYSTRGNYNPYTGGAGTRSPHPTTPSYGYTPRTPSYGSSYGQRSRPSYGSSYGSNYGSIFSDSYGDSDY